MPLDMTANANTKEGIKSPLSMLYHWEQSRGNDIFLTQPINGEYIDYTWTQVGDLARRVARRLKDLALPQGSRIGIFSKNCAEWFITDLGIMMAGHVSVPIFSTAGPDTVQYVLQHADVKLLFVGKLDNTEEQVASIPDAYHTVAFPYPGINTKQQWDSFIACDPIEGSPVHDMDSTMTIIYTSGSTGQPKGVVHSYFSICWAAQKSLDQLGVDQNDSILSYLPLAHITERVLVELASFYSGGKIHFVEALTTFQRDVVHCQPTLFISVPRLWTKFQMGVLAKMPQKKLDTLLKIPILNKIVAKKIRNGLGIDNARLWASGSAPLAPAVIEWFAKIGVKISEGWGMTENSAYGTGSVPFRHDKIGCIGKPYDGVDIRISEEGEIQVKAPCNMLEYYLEPDKTQEVFTEDGYLKTGDKGVIDADGYVKITGRLKDIFKTAKGKYVAPAPIESKFMENPIVEQVCVTGNNLPQPVALLVLSEEAQKKDKQGIEASLKKTFDAINAKLESHQVMDRVVIMKNEWSIENDLLTPTLKVKRHVLESRFNDVIQGNYNEPLVWVDA
ncbi:AMP-dependent synthetase [Alteromonas australica]|jgi:long-subunit acyl-CoA synthetase (AMP-forming)|uniref:AMP-dependent synthetase n=2 Tax=cellular organisms TaxID=131567 RepID=A0A075P7C8_9ALTE|nr:MULTISPECIES: AMP-binding protein [Alteromonas]MAB93356.1 AMP-dependent synthetase [Alteromonas sp.]MBL35845.1 AMP-dependent synthetase [Oceanospirillaceae bacterium]AIF99217.1 AMP-dependent synthetase [Alteromonas australica]AJP44276.1 AMP-dependent synthetase [Alteromonas australica]MAF70743.1 AMP-dependent synthetase [Alteromonas sp.]|tara:strand:+ start:8794 stop:10473 length:1680 start_codon:yes stop_codon:yes gene_type:complete